MKYIILCSSITYAMKGLKLLQRRGINSSVGRPSPEMTDCGCGYSLEFDIRDKDFALPLLYEEKIKIRGIYTKTDDGQLFTEKPCR